MASSQLAGEAMASAGSQAEGDWGAWSGEWGQAASPAWPWDVPACSVEPSPSEKLADQPANQTEAHLRAIRRRTASIEKCMWFMEPDPLIS